jgi:hypothetical protein
MAQEQLKAVRTSRGGNFGGGFAIIDEAVRGWAVRRF